MQCANRRAMICSSWNQYSWSSCCFIDRSSRNVTFEEKTPRCSSLYSLLTTSTCMRRSSFLLGICYVGWQSSHHRFYSPLFSQNVLYGMVWELIGIRLSFASFVESRCALGPHCPQLHCGHTVSAQCIRDSRVSMWHSPPHTCNLMCLATVLAERATHTPVDRISLFHCWRFSSQRHTFEQRKRIPKNDGIHWLPVMHVHTYA